MKDTNNKGSRDSNFTLGLQGECDKVKNSISPTIHPDSTLKKIFSLPWLILMSLEDTILENAKEFMGKKGENIKITNTHGLGDVLRVIKMKMNKGFSCNHF